MPCRTTSIDDTEEYKSTAPVTSTTQSHSLTRGYPPQYPGPYTHKTILAPVPIIAPPHYAEIPKIPLSADDAAEARLAVLLEKERGMRLDDGLAAYTDSSWEAKNSLGDTQAQSSTNREPLHPHNSGMYYATLT